MAAHRQDADARFKPGQTPGTRHTWRTGNHPPPPSVIQSSVPDAPRRKRATTSPSGSLRICMTASCNARSRTTGGETSRRQWRCTGWWRGGGKRPHASIMSSFSGPAAASTDPDETTIDRVELITRAELMRRNTRHNLPPEINALIAVSAG